MRPPGVPNATLGLAFDAGFALGSPALARDAKSSTRTRPSGPLPRTWPRSIPNFWAMSLTDGGVFTAAADFIFTPLRFELFAAVSAVGLAFAGLSDGGIGSFPAAASTAVSYSRIGL